MYTFVNFLVEQETLSPTIMYKKIRLNLPELLPRAIPTEDMNALLAAINTIRDRVLILLLLRTGMRIGELLNVKVADIILPERKILLYVGEKNYQGRVVYYSEDAERALREWLQTRDEQREYLFYSPSKETLSYVAAWMVMKKNPGTGWAIGQGIQPPQPAPYFRYRHAQCWFAAGGVAETPWPPINRDNTSLCQAVKYDTEK